MTALTAGIPRRTRLGDVLRAERIKLGSIRSTRWAAILAVVLSAGFTGLMAVGLFSAETEPGVDVDRLVAETFGPVPTLGAIGFAMLFAPALVGVLGALVVSSERGTGLIAATLSAVPRRSLVLGAKLIASTALSFALGLTTGLASFGIAEPAFRALGVAPTALGPVVVQVVLGGALYLALVGAISTAVAFLFRSSAAAVGAVLVLLLVLPGIVQLVPVIGARLATLLPTALGARLFVPVEDGAWATLLPSVLGLLAWTAAAASAAAVRFARSDA
ncbi:ABC transporter permease subunit [Agrococcus citreus]|uniref:ABC transporter permease n=1 Tax=Agrococcus citreus TaxID=84643 RepID=A0ABP4J9R4_9MICO